jgi:hypothetical protein
MPTARRRSISRVNRRPSSTGWSWPRNAFEGTLDQALEAALELLQSHQSDLGGLATQPSGVWG